MTEQKLGGKRANRVKLGIGLAIGLGMAFVTFNLGQWQTNRGDEKQLVADKQAQALQAAPITPGSANLDLEQMAYRQVDMQGDWVDGAWVYIDNRQLGARPAVQVVHAFRPKGADYIVPVDLGYLPRNPAQPRAAPPFPTADWQATSDATLRATILPRFAQSAELRGVQLQGAEQSILKENSEGAWVWSNFSLTEFAALTGMQVSNYVLTLQSVGPAAGPNPAPIQKVNGFYHAPVKLDEQVAKHRGYAFQWFSLTAALIILTGVFAYREFLRTETKDQP